MHSNTDLPPGRRSTGRRGSPISSSSFFSEFGQGGQVGVTGIDGSLLEWAMELVKCGGDFRRGSIDGDGEGHGRRTDMEG
jgi:hypothetical protein